MREVIEELLHGLAAARAHAHAPKAERLPRSLRPHAARATFQPADPRTARRVIV
ncbi:hypothetical protein [Microbacterium sp. SLBN-146]|uniref:hypothetical protein n=1 Tax=Microbacterium sp. SLBN-146 TaxID=2768457 RepID=UPI001171E3A6|nr:hypothetical protein [Microbacterium sp. SLBN-146]TQJ30204.1 hypothetical protein FBY39_0650 [Microbacterium sp. SLBN-146]